MPALGGRPAEPRPLGRRSPGGRFRTRHPAAPAGRGRPHPPARDLRVTAVQGRGRPRRPEAAGDSGAGQMPGSGGGPAGPDPLSPALQLAPGGSDAGGVAPQVPLPPGPGTQRDGRRGACGGRRGQGGLLRGRRGQGGGRGSRGAAVTRARGPPSARGGDVISPQPSSAPRRRGPRSPAAGAGAFRRARSQGFPRSCGRSPPRPSCRRPEVGPVCRAGRRRGRGDLRCAERVQTYPAFPRASSRALGPSGSSPRRAANSHPGRSQPWPQHQRRA